MRRHILRFAIVSVVVLTAGIGWGATREPYTTTQETLYPSRTVMVGATLSEEWYNFPYLLMPDFSPSYWFEKLDVELPLYVSWIMDYNHSGGTHDPVHLDPPQPLSSFSWFAGKHDRFVVQDVIQDLTDHTGYKTCAYGDGLEAPQIGSYPLTADGKLHITDTFGGIGSYTVIHLRDCRPAGNDPCAEMFDIYIEWDHPATWYDDLLGDYVDRLPGSATTDRFFLYRDNWYSCFVPRQIVAWPSTDLGVPEGEGPSPRYVDVGDLAYFATCLGRPIRYGFESESPPLSPTWQCNVYPFDGETINPTDLSVLSADLNKSCQLSKPGDSSEVAAIFEWFGIAPTGRMLEVGPNHEMLLPEYDVVDWEKTRRAIADPYGYRDNLRSTSAAKEVPWGLVKQLYR